VTSCCSWELFDTPLQAKYTWFQNQHRVNGDLEGWPIAVSRKKNSER